MFAKGQQATSRSSLDYVVGTHQNGRGQFNPDGLGRFEIDYEFESCRLLYWNVGGLRAFKYFCYESGDSAVHRHIIDAVGHQTSGLNIGSKNKHRGQTLLSRQRGNKRLAGREVTAGKHEQHLRRVLCEYSERRGKIVWRIFKFQSVKLQIDALCEAFGRFKLIGGQRVVQGGCLGPLWERLCQKFELFL